MIDKSLRYDGYKEPLKKYKEGHGYRGVLAKSKDGNLVQCHICGEMFKAIRTSHLKTHDIETQNEYKDLVGLAHDTKLMGDESRQKMLDNYLKRAATPVYLDKEAMKRMQKARIKSNKKRKGEKLKLEVRNKRGNCPDQLLDKIVKLKGDIGRTPTRRDFKAKFKGRFMETIYRTFGSWTKALKMAGMKPVSEVKAEKYEPVRLLEYVKMFYDKHKRPPMTSDFCSSELPDVKVYYKHWETLNEIRRIAGVPLVVVMGRSNVAYERVGKDSE